MNYKFTITLLFALYYYISSFSLISKDLGVVYKEPDTFIPHYISPEMLELMYNVRK